MNKYLLVDVATQKKYVESFGSEAVPFAPVVRENLMHITSVARQLGLPILSVIVAGEDNDMDEKVIDSLMEGGKQTLIEISDLSEWGGLNGYDAVFVYGIGVKFLEKVLGEFEDLDSKLWVVEDAIKDWDEDLENVFLDDVKEKFEARKITTRNLDKYLRM